MEFEWHKNTDGHLERQQVLPSGITRTEIILGVDFLYSTITDILPDSSRHTTRYRESPDLSDYQQAKQKDHQDTWPELTMVFNLPGEQLVEQIAFRDESSLNICVGKDMNWISKTPTPEEGNYAFIHLSYNPTGIVKAILQAEPLAKREEVLNLAGAAQAYLNIVKNSSVDARQTNHSAAQLLYDTDITKWFGDKNHPLVKNATEWSLALLASTLSLTITERALAEEAAGLFLENGWLEETTRALLYEARISKSTSIEETIEKSGGVEWFLASHLNILIRSDLSSILPESRRLLEISQITEREFSWQETEVNESFEDVTEDADLEYKVARAMLNEGTGRFGTPINIQGNTFKIDKGSCLLSVVCKLRRGKSWAAQFPIIIPFKEVHDIAYNLDADFRPIKELLRINFNH